MANVLEIIKNEITLNELFNLNKTGIIGGVSIAKVKEILIPLPPIKEQQRIVAQIEKLFEQLR